MVTCRELWVTAQDGLRLHARDHGPPAGAALPVICLPGLTRSAADFDALAGRLAGDPAHPRRVLAVDYRGRGRSDHDPDPRRYDVRVELADLLTVLTVAGIHEAVFVGTSRGGLITMALAAARPAAIRGAVLNDIGPVIERAGLLRIQGYVGKLPQPRSLAEGAAVLRGLFGPDFPRLDDAAWLAWAGRTWREEAGGLTLGHDPALRHTLDELGPDTPLPPLWGLFAGLKAVPVLAIRGAKSDLLSAETLAAMQAAHPALKALTVPDQGHAPLLEGEVAERVHAFVAAVEAGADREVT